MLVGPAGAAILASTSKVQVSSRIDVVWWRQKKKTSTQFSVLVRCAIGVTAVLQLDECYGRFSEMALSRMRQGDLVLGKIDDHGLTCLSPPCFA